MPRSKPDVLPELPADAAPAPAVDQPLDNVVDGLIEKINRLEQRLNDQTSPPAAAAPATPAHAGSSNPSRREMLRRLGFAAAGLAAASTTALATQPAMRADAASGDFLILGNVNLTSDTTYLSQTTGVNALNRKAVLWGDWNPSSASATPSLNAGVAGTAGADSSGVGGVGGYFQGSLAPLLLVPATATNAPTTGAHKRGELYVDSAGSFFYCLADGTPGTWQAIGGPAASALPNSLINGNFDVWQRGSFTLLPAGLAFPYTADRWRLTKDGTGTGTVSQQSFVPGQTGVLGEPTFYLQYQAVAGSGATGNHLNQMIESVRTLAGQQATLSFYAKATPAIPVTAGFVQRFGTGGSSDVGTTLGSFTLTSSWTKYSVAFRVPSISGKTIGTAGTDDCMLLFMMPLNTSFTVAFAQIQLESGGNATPFKRRSFGEELVLCQRYYQKSFPYGTAPAQNAGRTGETYLLMGTAGPTAQNLNQVVFQTPMRATPALTYYNPVGLNALARQYSPSNTDCTTTTTAFSSEKNFVIQVTPPAVAVGSPIGVHWTADAEL